MNLKVSRYGLVSDDLHFELQDFTRKIEGAFDVNGVSVNYKRDINVVEQNR